VTHFRYEQRGKRPLHKKPRRLELASYRAWLESELAAIAPRIFCKQTIATRTIRRQFYGRPILRNPRRSGLS
jgi:hypothetical protein